MAVTSTQSSNDGISNVAVGRYITSSTAAAFDLTVGFTPRYVKIVNVTSGDMMEWFEGMAAASAQKTVAAGTRSLITSLGVTVTGGVVTVGLDTDVNVINEQLSWVMIG